MNTKTCKQCGQTKLATTHNFNRLPGGTLRNTCKVCMAERTKRHYYKDPEKVKRRVARYKEQKRNAPGSYEQSDIDNIRRTLKDRCYYCGVQLFTGGELDHMVPISRGGSNDPKNLTLACRTCNRDKHNKTAEEFLQWRYLHGYDVNLIHERLVKNPPVSARIPESTMSKSVAVFFECRRCGHKAAKTGKEQICDKCGWPKFTFY